MNRKTTSISIFIITAVALMALLLAGCQTIPAEQTSNAVAPDPHHAGESIAGERTISSGTGASLSSYYVAPTSIQDLVNRYDVAFIGTISSVREPVEEKPYEWDPELDAHLKNRGLPPFRVRVTYYDIMPDTVYLDDGNLLDDDGNPVASAMLRLFGDHSTIRPQVGEKFFFTLQANPDGSSYGVNADWNLIHLDGGAIRNFDGKEPGYDGVTDEATLKSAAQTAASNRVQLPVEEWPVQAQWLDDDEDEGQANSTSGN